MDHNCCGADFKSLDKAGETIQICCDLCDYAKKWCWTSHCKLLLLGQCR
ncbi:hypothetical protein E2320_001379 [Naja naja]|nr:hypothetical protein E2320_001379 [Naja naja]